VSICLHTHAVPFTTAPRPRSVSIFASQPCTLLACISVLCLRIAKRLLQHPARNLTAYALRVLITAVPYTGLVTGKFTCSQADLKQSYCLDFLSGLHTPILSVSLPETTISTEPKRHFLEGHRCPSLLLRPLY
jgi:hypothetical protein